MIGNYKIITLCGSTKFKDEFMEMQKILTLEGNLILSVGAFGHSGDKEVWTEGTKEMLDDMHKRKIDLADEIFVIDKNGYIGESTKSEIEYAINTGKKVNYMSEYLNRNKKELNNKFQWEKPKNIEFKIVHTSKQIEQERIFKKFLDRI